MSGAQQVDYFLFFLRDFGSMDDIGNCFCLLCMHGTLWVILLWNSRKSYLSGIVQGAFIVKLCGTAWPFSVWSFNLKRRRRSEHCERLGFCDQIASIFQLLLQEPGISTFGSGLSHCSLNFPTMWHQRNFLVITWNKLTMPPRAPFWYWNRSSTADRIPSWEAGTRREAVVQWLAL